MRKFAIIMSLIISTNVYSMQMPDEDVSKARLLLSEDRWIQMHYFMQTGFKLGFNESNMPKDFYVNRARLIFNGQAAEEVFFFMQTEDVKINSINTGTPSTYFTKDAYAHYRPFEQFQIYMGLLAVPFSRQSCQSDATTLGTDKAPRMNPISNLNYGGRDLGLMFKGLVLWKYLEYRVGFYEGYGRKKEKYDNDAKTKTRNKYDIPRMTTRLQLGILDKEEGYFYSENYLGKRNVAALGLGFDFQPSITDTKNNGDYKNYYGFSVDLTIDKSIDGGTSIPFQTGFYYSINNPAEKSLYSGQSFYSMYGLYAQTGILLVEKYQPYFTIYQRGNKEAKNGKDVMYRSVIGGFTYFFNGHFANIKTEYHHPFADNTDFDNEKKIVIQTQIYF